MRHLPEFDPNKLPEYAAQNRDTFDAPFRWKRDKNENINLADGSLNYSVTDFVLPGKNGMDFVLKRSYNSSNAGDKTFGVERGAGKQTMFYFQIYYVREYSGPNYPDPDDKYDYDLELVGGPYANANDRDEARRNIFNAMRDANFPPDEYPGGVMIEKDGLDTIKHYYEYKNSSDSRERFYPFFTAARANDHFTKNHKLGYGWSFNFPSIEKTVSGFHDDGSEKYAYYLHLDDGRSFEIKNNKLDDHPLQDVAIQSQGGTLVFPNDGVSHSYQYIVSFSDGVKLYLDAENIVAREDCFGNRIYYSFSESSIRIVDTYNRAVELRKSIVNAGSYSLQWILPDGKTVTYLIENELLKSVTDKVGNTTAFSYTDGGADARLFLQYSGDQGTSGNAVRYKLLTQITHPTGAKTKYSYRKERVEHRDDISYLGILESVEGHPGNRFENRYVVQNRYDEETVDLNNYTRNLVDYSYQFICYDTRRSQEPYFLDPNYKSYIMQATVSDARQSVTETFTEKHQTKSSKETRGGLTVSNGSFFYGEDKNAADYKLPIRQVTTRYGLQGQSIEKNSVWEYSSDRKANVIRHTESYSDLPDCDQETIISYDPNYSMPVEKSIRKDVSTKIIERYMLKGGEPDGKPKVYEYRRVYEDSGVGEILKEKTKYEYDGAHRLTGELRYYTAAGGDLESSGNYYRTAYSYGGGFFTPEPSEIRQEGVRDADGALIPSSYGAGVLRTAFVYDACGRVTQKTDPNGNATDYTLDGLGRVTTETYPAVDGKRRGKTAAYNDAANHVTVTEEASDNKTVSRRSEYTPLGKLNREVIYSTGTPETVLKSCGYDSLERLVLETVYDGSGGAKASTVYSYDSFDRVTLKTVSGSGVDYREEHVYTDLAEGKYFRDQKTVRGDATYAADVVTVTDADRFGRVREEYAGGVRTASYHYDKLGNKTSCRDAKNWTTEWRYDHAGRVTHEIRATESGPITAETRYDELGNKRWSTDFMGRQTKFTHDAAGRLVLQDSPLEGAERAVTKFYYDAAGNLTKQMVQKDASTWRTTEYGYDARGRQTQAILHGESGSFSRTRYEYDGLGNKLRVLTGLTEKPADAAAVTSYAYDHFGNVLAMTDARSNDPATAAADRRTESFVYDAVGVLRKKTDRNGYVTDYEHDGLGRLTRESVTADTPNGTIAGSRSYAYTRTGLKLLETVSEDGPALTTSYYYDNRAQLVRQLDPGGIEKQYTYDANGNRETFRLYRNGSLEIDLHYAYDSQNRLRYLRKGGAGGTLIAEYTYDANGNRKTLTYPQAGIETAYIYNDANLVTSLVNRLNGAVKSSWTYGYTLDGNQRYKKDTVSNRQTDYAYDLRGRLTVENTPGWRRQEFGYDRFSNRKKLTVTNLNTQEKTTTEYGYHPNNWLLKETRTGKDGVETLHYYYDAGGNQVRREREFSRPKPAGSHVPGRLGFAPDGEVLLELRNYNGFGQLVWVYRDTEESTYTYRADGLRHSKTVKGVITTHHWDGQNIVAESGGSGMKARYLRGINLVAQEIDANSFYYLFNAHGDVVQQIQNNGTAKTPYDYDAFGNQKEAVIDPNPFRYCGEYHDSETGNVYLRARYYEPGSGRFLSEDSAQDGLNWYIYCNNNPIAMIDPSGNTAQLNIVSSYFKNQLKTLDQRVKDFGSKISNTIKNVRKTVANTVKSVGRSVAKAANQVKPVIPSIRSPLDLAKKVVNSVFAVADSFAAVAGVGVGLGAKLQGGVAEIGGVMKNEIAIKSQHRTVDLYAVNEVSAKASVLIFEAGFKDSYEKSVSSELFYKPVGPNGYDAASLLIPTGEWDHTSEMYSGILKDVSNTFAVGVEAYVGVGFSVGFEFSFSNLLKSLKDIWYD